MKFFGTWSIFYPACLEAKKLETTIGGTLSYTVSH